MPPPWRRHRDRTVYPPLPFLLTSLAEWAATLTSCSNCTLWSPKTINLLWGEITTSWATPSATAACLAEFSSVITSRTSPKLDRLVKADGLWNRQCQYQTNDGDRRNNLDQRKAANPSPSY